MGSNLETWKALERIRKDGRCRSIGVSNFAPKHLNELLIKGNDRPVVNQIELSPFLQQESISSFCHKENIHLTGYCPLARGRRLDDPKLCLVAEQTKKTVAQVMIRWALQRGQSVIPKSVRPERIQENANVFEFNLNDEQMKQYLSLFEKYFLKSFTSRLTDYSDPKIDVLSTEVLNPKYTIVKSVLLATDKKPAVNIEWRVYTKNPDKPLIRDLIIEGLSLARTQKEEFASVIETNNGDVTKLFITLKEFAAK